MLSSIKSFKILDPHILYHDEGISLQLWSCSSSELSNCSWSVLDQCVLRIVKLFCSHQKHLSLKCFREEEISFSLGLPLAEFDILKYTEYGVFLQMNSALAAQKMESILLHLVF